MEAFGEFDLLRIREGVGVEAGKLGPASPDSGLLGMSVNESA